MLDAVQYKVWVKHGRASVDAVQSEVWVKYGRASVGCSAV